jgi:pyruvate ferredoxin oxidoreductase beta subunit
LRPQKRFAHLFKDAVSEQRVARLQELADRNIAEFGLLDPDGDL